MARTLTKRPLTKPYQTSLRVSETTATQITEIRDMMGIQAPFSAVVESAIAALHAKLKKEKKR